MNTIKAIILLLLLALFSWGCQKTVETSDENLERLLNKDRIVLVEQLIGGSIFEFAEQKIEFIATENDSVQVLLTHWQAKRKYWPSVRISHSSYQEIHRGLECLVNYHDPDKEPIGGCIGPTSIQYFVTAGNKTIRLYDSRDYCEFENVLESELSYSTLLLQHQRIEEE